jgi:sigma54-dependent transcription regulator
MAPNGRVDNATQMCLPIVAIVEPLATLISGGAVTLEQDRAEIERVAVSWQDVPEPEQEAMLASLGKMLEYLDSSEDAEYQLRLDAERLITKIEAGLGR